MNSLVTFIEQTITAKKIDAFGKDGLLHSSLPYYILPGILIYGLFTVWDNAWSVIFIAYSLLPLFDQIFTHDLRNPNQEQRKDLEKNNYKFLACLYVTIAIDWYFFYLAMKYFSNVQFTTWQIFNLIPLLFIFSNLNAVQFTTAHQIFHKQGWFNRILGTLHMSKNLYMHFTYEHLYGHHRRVATPLDPASAQQGIDVYRFAWRSFVGSYKSVYKMEKEEQKKPFYTNYAVLSVLASIAFTYLVYLGFGPQATAFFLFEALFSIFYLEAINYIEHYGLRRKQLSNGEYEKVTIRHSWNAPHRFTNYLLFKLQRHSDHHQNALKPYQTLLTLDESPLLPYGYTTMIVVAMFPQKWFEIMDPLVEQYKKYQIGTIKTELTQKSLSLTRQFTIKLTIFIVSLWLISLLKY